MDVQKRLTLWRVGLGIILLLGLLLRLKGLHDPLLDHPGWRQGDTASIARNFATLNFNPLYPQTNYDGPPPNYVELELQIVPFLAAVLYKIAGVHEIFGRLISIAFNLGTIAVLAYFARWIFASDLAGLLAALLFAVMPGSVYYARTFMPEATMVFFATAALFVTARLLVDEERWKPRAIAGAAALLALAFLAKPVSLVILVPLAVLAIERFRSGRTINAAGLAVLAAVPLAILYGYDRVVSSHAEWHWASGITRLHVIPSLLASLHDIHALRLKLHLFRLALAMLATTMIGPAIAALAIVGFFLLPKTVRSRALLWSWLFAGLVYVYVVVTVERVDYYMFVLLPLAALTGAGFLERLFAAVANANASQTLKWSAAAVAVVALGAVTYQNTRIIAPYYRYNKAVYRNAVALDHTLAKDALIVMGHYDPSILYYIGRYGWEEDPYLWTPFDEQSAIHKGARYYVDIERNRFNRNLELCAWMQRFPVLNSNAVWPVYETDPALVKPGAEAQWRAFRNAEKIGQGRAWLDAHGLCM